MKKICEQCGNEHDGSYGSGRFCSKKCARGFSGSNRTIESRKKTAVSVSKEHEHICPKCGKLFMHKGTGKALCDECKIKPIRVQERTKIQKNIKDTIVVSYCKYCGAEKGKCLRPEICKHYQLLPKMIKYFGFDQNTLGSIEFYAEYDRVVNFVYDLYWNQKMSIQQIKEYVNYPSSAGALSHFLYKIIPIRNLSQSVQNAIAVGRLKLSAIETAQFKTGFHKTWQNKTIFFRSSYEEDYCKELDVLKIPYDVETLIIEYYDSQQKHMRFAFPDFYLPEQNLIVEVKSAFTIDVQNMKDKFLQYKALGYNVDLLYEHVHYPDMTYFEKFNGDVAELVKARGC